MKKILFLLFSVSLKISASKEMRHFPSGDIRLTFSAGGKNYEYNFKSHDGFLTPEW